MLRSKEIEMVERRGDKFQKIAFTTVANLGVTHFLPYDDKFNVDLEIIFFSYKTPL